MAIGKVLVCLDSAVREDLADRMAYSPGTRYPLGIQRSGQVNEFSIGQANSDVAMMGREHVQTAAIALEHSVQFRRRFSKTLKRHQGLDSDAGIGFYDRGPIPPKS
jgi:hypothetical protein